MITILIPLRNEYENLEEIGSVFEKNFNNIDHEIILINDFSSDNTLLKAREISDTNKNFIVLNNKKQGLGGAINLGIENAKGEFICIMMADFSDDMNDLKKYYSLIVENNFDAIFGSRFIKNSKVINYPRNKLIINRFFNFLVKIVFFNNYNDYTNAFKIYKANVLKSFLPLVSESFNVFLEIPLKTISRGYTFKVVPISWTGRKKGVAKFKIQELGSKYFFTMLYCLIEKLLLKKKKNQ